ncbi:MAG: fibronectin type III domain-containing protein [Candidatus Riflebacteria bacterium]|nr:fibronectin type III domain-containing protein [Candidatus Riflebacteria bacterium]
MRSGMSVKRSLIPVLIVVAFVLAGCSDSSVDKGALVNPIGSYQSETSTSTLVTNGQTQTPGALSAPVVTIPTPTDGRNDHTNAPLLDNWHPGWQQTACFTCHSDQSRIPDHNYANTSLCYLCHGTNGLPGFGDATPPVVKGIITGPTQNSVVISWTTDEECISRLVVRTLEGDRMEFPVSSEYNTSHRYTVNGLVPDTTYSYEIKATDRSGNVTSTSSIGNLNFTTLPKVEVITSTTTSTAVTGFFLSLTTTVTTPYSVKVKFKTAELCTAKVNVEILSLGTERTYDGPTTANTEFDMDCGGLYASSSYRLYITAVDLNGTTRTSTKRSFVTPQSSN